MDEAGLRADMLGKAGQEGDHVMLDLGLDLVDPGHVETTTLPHRFGGLGGDHPERGLGVTGMGFDLEPDAEPVLRLPDFGHRGTGIARDHREHPGCERYPGF
jgi:hypothetical protein